MKKKLYQFSVLLVLSALVAYSGQAVESCRDGLRICAKVLIPSLFPYFVLSSALVRLGLPSIIGRTLAPFASKVYGISPAGASALCVGLLGGYPSGAGYIAQLQKSGAVTANEAERLLGFCNNSGPAFIIGAVGVGVFSSAKIGLLLYISHVLSAFISGLFFRSRNAVSYDQSIFLDETEPDLLLPECIKQAALSIISVCGFVVFFTTLSGLLDANGALSGVCGFVSEHTGAELRFVRTFLVGILELGSASGVMRGIGSGLSSVCLASFIVGWGGLSVHMQPQAMLQGSNIKGTLHLTGRLLSAALGAVIAGLLYSIIM